MTNLMAMNGHPSKLRSLRLAPVRLAKPEMKGLPIKLISQWPMLGCPIFQTSNTLVARMGVLSVNNQHSQSFDKS